MKAFIKHVQDIEINGRKTVTLYMFKKKRFIQYTVNKKAKIIAVFKFKKMQVDNANLTKSEFMERERLLELQKSKIRYFSQEEFERLHYLSKKLSNRHDRTT